MTKRKWLIIIFVVLVILITVVTFSIWKWQQIGYPRWVYNSPLTCKPLWNCIIVDPALMQPIRTTSISKENKLDELTETKIVNLAPQDNNGPWGSYVYIIGDKEHILTLDFNQQIKGNESLDNFEKYLDGRFFHVQFPEKKIDSKVDRRGDSTSIPRAVESDLQEGEIAKVNFSSYENGRLKGKLTAKLRQVSYGVTSADPDCQMGDLISYCYQYVPANINLQINFDFKLQ